MSMRARALASALVILLLAVPAVQLSAPLSADVAQDIGVKGAAKTLTSVRAPAVASDGPGVEHLALGMRRFTTTDRPLLPPGFSAAPFVPPRA
jgi:hypothetical protein